MAKKTITEGTLSDIENQDKSTNKRTIISESKEIFGGYSKKESERPIAGFLISYSANDFGNYWVLYEGRNLIGKSSENDISISDDSISTKHAILNIRRSRNDNRLMTAITDQNSTNGTFVNEEDIEFSTKELKDKDVLQIGNYDLLLNIVDKKEHNLLTKENLNLKTKAHQKDEVNLTSPYDFSVNPKSKKATKFE